jgi:hypothetical protein
VAVTGDLLSVEHVFFFRFLHTLAAERQVRDFLIGPRNKNNEKKGRPLKFFIHRSKLQAGISEEIQHTEAGACLCLLPLHPPPFLQRQLAGTHACGSGTRYRAD